MRADEKTDTPAGAFAGAFEGCDGMVAYGWAHDPSRPALRVGLDIMADGRLVDRIVADRPRPDLTTAGLGDGQCGFFAVLPAALCDGRLHRIAVVGTGSGRALPGGPRDVVIPQTGLAATVALLDERRRLQHRLMVNSQDLLNAGRRGQDQGCMAFDPALGEIYRRVIAGWPDPGLEEER